MSKKSPFDFIMSINNGKVNNELDVKDYSPFLANRQYSYFKDTVLLANEMNQHSDLDHNQQYLFYINTIRPRKRFTKWAKPDHHQDVKNIIEYFDVNHERANEIASILSSEQKMEIQNILKQGGTDGQFNSRGSS